MATTCPKVSSNCLPFARVLASDPEILVLDEATSSIDTGTELIIQDALHKLTEGRTSIIIAHRLQTIQECDRILVLHHGAVQELGTHEELVAQRGIYYTLHELQFQDSKVAAELTGEKNRERKPRLRWVDRSSDDDDEPPFSGRRDERGLATASFAENLILPPSDADQNVRAPPRSAPAVRGRPRPHLRSTAYPGGAHPPRATR